MRARLAAASRSAFGALIAGRAAGEDTEAEPALRYHQYKFIVDGKWKHEEAQAFVMDPLGNTNNWWVPAERRGAAERAQEALRAWSSRER